MVTCPQCGELNRPGANACLNCGFELRERSSEPREGLVKRFARGLLGFGKREPTPADAPMPGDPATGPEPAPPPAAGPEQKPTQLPKTAPLPPLPGTEPKPAPTQLPKTGPLPAAPGTATQLPKTGPLQPPAVRMLANRYALTRAYPLSYSTYHDAYDLLCEICGQRFEPPAPGGAWPTRCTQCASPLYRRLIHATDGPTPGLPSANIVHLSRTAEHVVPHALVFTGGDTTFAVLDALPEWQPLSHLRAPAPFEQTLQWCTDLGAALTALHANGVCWNPHAPAYLETIVLVLQGTRAVLADISHARLLPIARAGTLAEKARRATARDVAFLAHAWFFMLTRQTLDPAPGNEPASPAALPEQAPAAIQSLLASAFAGDYDTAQAFLQALRTVVLTRPSAQPADSAPA